MALTRSSIRTRDMQYRKAVRASRRHAHRRHRLTRCLHQSTRVSRRNPIFTRPRSKRCHLHEEKKMNMKLRYVAPLAIAASAAAIGLAPIAAADATVHQSPGNAEITATPGAAAQEAAQDQQPFGGDMGALLFHH